MFLGPFAAYHYYFFRRQNYSKILLAPKTEPLILSLYVQTINYNCYTVVTHL